MSWTSIRCWPIEPAAPRVGHVRAGRRAVRARRLVPRRFLAEPRSVVRRRRDLEARVLFGLRSGLQCRRPRRLRAATIRSWHSRGDLARERLDRRGEVRGEDERADAVLEREADELSIQSSAEPSGAGRFRSRRISAGSRPASTAASSIALFPAASPLSPRYERLGSHRRPFPGEGDIRGLYAPIESGRRRRRRPSGGPFSVVVRPLVFGLSRLSTSQSARITSIASLSASTLSPGRSRRPPIASIASQTRRRRGPARPVRHSGCRGSRPRGPRPRAGAAAG